jgi:hypothetical protein
MARDQELKQLSIGLMNECSSIVNQGAGTYHCQYATWFCSFRLKDRVKKVKLLEREKVSEDKIEDW